MSEAERAVWANLLLAAALGLAIVVAMHALARAELIDPSNCAHLREGIAELEQRGGDRGLSPIEIATLEYLKRWQDREQCNVDVLGSDGLRKQDHGTQGRNLPAAR